MLSKDYKGLVQAFIKTGFVGSPIEWRAQEKDPWQLTHPDGDTATVMAEDLRTRMEAVTGGGSRFGALSVVLGDMGYFWQMHAHPATRLRYPPPRPHARSPCAPSAASPLRVRPSAAFRRYTPPYIILLIRTFLTLEGIAGQVDPNFNIYQVRQLRQGRSE